MLEKYKLTREEIKAELRKTIPEDILQHITLFDYIVVADAQIKKIKKAVGSYKLYIWRGIRADYTDGIGFAVGRSKEEAMEAIHNISEQWEWDLYEGELITNEPEIHDFPYGGWIGGGG